MTPVSLTPAHDIYRIAAIAALTFAILALAIAASAVANG